MHGNAIGAQESVIRRADWVFAGLIPVIVVVLFGGVLDMWWGADDPMVLWHDSQHGPLNTFLDPEVWRSFNPASLTPWLLMSLDSDLALFGLEPAGFYLHQLVGLAAAALVLFACLRLFLSPVASAAGVVVLLTAPASVEIASNLATRHYVEGLVFACLSFFLFVLSIRRSSRSLQLLAAACFALALTAKEIFVPLPIVLAFLPEGDPRTRLRRLGPFALIGGIYFGWRFWMLGSFGGGYRDRFVPSGAEIVAWLRTTVEGNDFSTDVLLAGGLAVVICGAVALVGCSAGWRWFWVGFACCVVLPVVPVVHVFSSRHAFGVAVFAAAVVAALVDRLTDAPIGHLGRWLVSVACVGLLLVAGSGAQAGLPADDHVQRIRVEGEEVLRGGHQKRVIVAPLMPYWHFFGLLRLREEVLVLDPGSGVLADACLEGSLGGDRSIGDWRLLRFDPTTGNLIESSEPDPPCRFLEDGDLSVRIRFDSVGNSTTWQFGPHVNGRFTVLWAVADNSLIGIDVPAQGQQRGDVAFEMGVELLVGYESPNHGWAVTPRLAGTRRGDVVEIVLPADTQSFMTSNHDGGNVR